MSYHVHCAGVPQIIGAVPGIQHGEPRVTTDGKYSPNVAMSIVSTLISSDWRLIRNSSHGVCVERLLEKFGLIRQGIKVIVIGTDRICG